MGDHNDYLVMPDLMMIDHRRQDGSLTAPPMRRDFAVRGPMLLEPGLIDFFELTINGLMLTINGIPLGFTYQSPQ